MEFPTHTFVGKKAAALAADAAALEAFVRDDLHYGADGTPVLIFRLEEIVALPRPVLRIANLRERVRLARFPITAPRRAVVTDAISRGEVVQFVVTYTGPEARFILVASPGVLAAATCPFTVPFSSLVGGGAPLHPPPRVIEDSQDGGGEGGGAPPEGGGVLPVLPAYLPHRANEDRPLEITLRSLRAAYLDRFLAALDDEEIVEVESAAPRVEETAVLYLLMASSWSLPVAQLVATRYAEWLGRAIARDATFLPRLRARFPLYRNCFFPSIFLATLRGEVTAIIAAFRERYHQRDGMYFGRAPLVLTAGFRVIAGGQDATQNATPSAPQGGGEGGSAPPNSWLDVDME